MNEICMILDFECFCIDGKQQCRELGYYTHNHKYGREAFYMKKSYKWLSDKDKRTVNFVKRKIHGLSYQPRKEENAKEWYTLEDTVHNIYDSCKKEGRDIVAYKGGHVERDLLNKLHIPCLNLETFGCPKYDVLKHEFPGWLPSCRFHSDENIHHCPMKECETFWLWILEKLYSDDSVWK